MNKATSLLSALLISFSAFSQNTDSSQWNRFTAWYANPYKTFEPARVLSIQGSAMLSSKGINNQFMYPFVFGKRLEKEVIDRNLKSDKNKRVQFDRFNELKFTNLEAKALNKSNLHWFLVTGNEGRSYANVTKGAMKLIFKGNTDSTRYDFSNSSYYNLQLNKMGGGLYYHDDKAEQPYNFSVALNIIQAVKFESIRTFERNYIEGNEDSVEIGANYDAIFARSKFPSKQGLGLGLDLAFNQRLSKDRIWGFSLSNSGFANFNKKVTTYTANGEYTFDGVYIPQIGRLGEDGYFKSQLDSFTNQLTNKKENQNKTVWIAPATFVYYTTKIKSAYYQFSLRHNGTLAMPTGEIKYMKFLSSKMLLGISAGAGGSYYLNTEVNWALSCQWFIQMAVYHLEALALPKPFGGLGGMYGVQYIF